MMVRLGVIRPDESTAAEWQDEWLALPRPIVPVMVIPDGYVSRGLGALARLAQLAENLERVEKPVATDVEGDETPTANPADMGGESPCFAHLMEE